MRKKILIVLGIIVLILIGLVLFRVSRPSVVPSDVATGVVLSEKDIQNLVQMVGKHINIPSNEKPNVGVVTDINTLLQKEPFYKDAKNGDILLIYPSISRAILFDPEQDRIINVGPVVFENPEGGPVSSTDTTQ